jgi:hypothetical protein
MDQFLSDDNQLLLREYYLFGKILIPLDGERLATMVDIVSLFLYKRTTKLALDDLVFRASDFKTVS